MENPEGERGHTKNPFREGGMDIFWNHTFQKCAEMPPRSAISCCSIISNLKKDILYNLIANIGQWYNKDKNDRLIFSNRNKRSESARTIEELSLEFVLQSSKCYFQNFLLKAKQGREKKLGG